MDAADVSTDEGLTTAAGETPTLPEAARCRSVLHKVKTLRLRARCGDTAAGARGLMPKGKMRRGNLGEMRRKQGETKIPQSRGACGTRIFNFLSVNLFCLQQKVYFLFEVLAWELCSSPHPTLSYSSLPYRYVLKIWNI